MQLIDQMSVLGPYCSCANIPLGFRQGISVLSINPEILDCTTAGNAHLHPDILPWLTKQHPTGPDPKEFQEDGTTTSQCHGCRPGPKKHGSEDPHLLLHTSATQPPPLTAHCKALQGQSLPRPIASVIETPEGPPLHQTDIP